MDQYIDLVIPRGSGELVRSIQQQSKNIPVLGHAEGICHVYVDREADPDKALKISTLKKNTYHSFNTMIFSASPRREMRLPVSVQRHGDAPHPRGPRRSRRQRSVLHRRVQHAQERGGTSTLNNKIEIKFYKVCSQVKIYSGPVLNRYLTFGPPPAKSLRTEYSGLECTVEVVRSVNEAVEHIHKYGSSHTEAIITENSNSIVPQSVSSVSKRTFEQARRRNSFCARWTALACSTTRARGSRTVTASASVRFALSQSIS